MSKLNPKKYYVYQLIDPRNDEVFYVGKGCGNRINTHEQSAQRGDKNNPRKTLRIMDIISAGFKVQKFYYSNNLCESDAFDLEKELIKEIGREKLTNHSSGVETARERAKVLLKRIKPLRQWAAEKYACGGYSIEDLKRYKLVASFIRRMAAGQIKEKSVLTNGQN